MPSAPILEVNNLSLAFRGEHQRDAWKLNNVSFNIYANQTVGIVGESGSGKSVTALSILKLMNPHMFSEFSGKIMFDGKDIFALSERELRTIRGREIGMIFQDPMTSLNPTHTILKQVSENIRSQSINKEEKAKEILTKVGLHNPEDFLHRFPHGLSGGERQRVMIAMAIINHPRLLIADEPTTALDVTVENRIIDLLKTLQKNLNLSLLFVTHDLTLIRKIADHIIVMKEGRVVEQGKTREIIENPQEAYTQELFHNVPKPLQPRNYSQSPLLTVKNLSVSYPIKSPFLKRLIYENVAVKKVSFNLTQGRTLGIIGESGSGKTTLLMAILKLIPAQGEIHYRGENINALTSKQFKKLRRNIQVVFQDSHSSLNPRLTVEEIIGEGLEIHYPNLSESKRNEQIEEVMTEVELPRDSRKRLPHEFSGGQRQRINLARALILKPELVLLDEPTSSLDVSLQKQVIDFLLQFQDKKKLSYIFISHDLRVIQSVSDWVIVMKKGEIVESGLKEDIFKNDDSRHPYTRSLISSYF